MERARIMDGFGITEQFSKFLTYYFNKIYFNKRNVKIGEIHSLEEKGGDPFVSHGEREYQPYMFD